MGGSAAPHRGELLKSEVRGGHAFQFSIQGLADALQEAQHSPGIDDYLTHDIYIIAYI